MLSHENNQTKVSIIIPIYNAEKYLQKCLDSIRNQKYTNLEVILVDDGSTDNSTTICDEYESVDSRFISIHVQNNGVSNARNIGIKKASGEFLMFVDSDDWLEENSVGILQARMEQNAKIDFIASSYYDIYDERRELQLLDEQEIGGKAIAQFSKNNYLLFATPWAKMYRKKIIEKNDLFFDVCVKYGEDLLFNMQYLKYSTLIATLKEPVYNYRLMVEGSAQTKYFPDMWIYRIKVYTAVCELVGKELEDIAGFFLGTGLGHYGIYIKEASSYIGMRELINYFSDRVGEERLKNKFGYFKGKLIYKKNTKILYYLMLFKYCMRRPKQ